MHKKVENRLRKAEAELEKYLNKNGLNGSSKSTGKPGTVTVSKS